MHTTSAATNANLHRHSDAQISANTTQREQKTDSFRQCVESTALIGATGLTGLSICLDYLDHVKRDAISRRDAVATENADRNITRVCIIAGGFLTFALVPQIASMTLGVNRMWSRL